MTDLDADQGLRPGTARLSVAVPVAVLGFFYMSVLEYALPPYGDWSDGVNGHPYEIPPARRHRKR